MPKRKVRLTSGTPNQVVNQRERRMQTFVRKMLELQVRCHCLVSSVVMWQNPSTGEVSRVYIFDPNTNLVMHTLNNLEKVPVVLRYKKAQMMSEYNRTIAKIKGRTPLHKNIRNEEQVAPNTVYDYVAALDVPMASDPSPTNSPSDEWCEQAIENQVPEDMVINFEPPIMTETLQPFPAVEVPRGEFLSLLLS